MARPARAETLEASGAATDCRHPQRPPENGGKMWMWFGIGGFLYLVLAFTLGFMTLRNRHGWMFFFGIFFPFLWILGAFMRPTTGAYA